MPAPEAEYEQARTLVRGSPGGVHLMGAGGVGVAGLARLLAGQGWRASGCDTTRNRLTAWLEARGIPVRLGHEAAHVTDGLSWLIRTSAVRADHPEVQEALRRRIPVIRRGAALAALARAGRSIAIGGTHGKTTTTAMIARIAREVDPGTGCAIGGEVPDWDGVATPPRPGAPFVLEADESDGTLALYEPEVGVVTNVDYDHMEHFADEEAFFNVFRTFARRTRRALILGADDPAARAVLGDARRPWLCGLSADARVRGENVRRGPDGVVFEVRHEGRRKGTVVLPVPGLHNVRNALCAIGAALALEWPFETAQAALAGFRPARRRLQPVWNREGVRVFSDYAHHPTEIRALLDTVADFRPRRILAVFQPHRYTRTRALGARWAAAFDGVAHLWLLPVYAASEPPLEGGTSEDLRRHFERAGGSPPTLVATREEAWEALRKEWRSGDVVLIIGAGDIERLADRFLKESAGAGSSPA